jgi:hypothetical protein
MLEGTPTGFVFTNHVVARAHADDTGAVGLDVRPRVGLRVISLMWSPERAYRCPCCTGYDLQA